MTSTTLDPYRGDDGTERELRQEWLVVDNLPPALEDDATMSTAAASLGLDVETDAANRAKTVLFAPHVLDELGPGTDPIGPVASAELGADVAGEELRTRIPGVFRAREVQTSSGTFGHIRIFTCNVRDPEQFVDEFVRVPVHRPQGAHPRALTHGARRNERACRRDPGRHGRPAPGARPGPAVDQCGRSLRRCHTGLANDFQGAERIEDVLVDNASPNNHAVCGYLRTHAVRSAAAALVPVQA